MNNQDRTIFGFSVDGLLEWTNVLYLLSVAAAAFFSVALWRLSAISSANKDRQLDRYKVEAAERISSAEAIAKKAQEASSLADERSKGLALEAENAKLETERLKAQMAWRTIPHDISAKLKEILSTTPAKVNIQHVANDPEALYLAIQIANIFGEAKWEVQMLAVTMAGSLVFGIFVPDNQSPETSFEFIQALVKCKLIFHKTPFLRQGWGLGDQFQMLQLFSLDQKNHPLIKGLRYFSSAGSSST